MSLLKILDYIAGGLRERYPTVQRIDAACVRLKTGQVVAYGTSGEFAYRGISDTVRLGMYVRIDPNISYAPSPRQFTSGGRFVEVTVNCTLVAYAFGDKFNGLELSERLREQLRTMRWGTYAGGREQSIRVLPQRALVQEHEVYKQEMGKEYEYGDTGYSALALTFQIKYVTQEDRCAEDCAAFATVAQC